MRLAPSPPAEPVFGHARALARRPLQTLLRWMTEHGPVVRFRVGRREAHVVFAPEGIRRVLADPDGIYGKDTHGYRTLRLFVGDGLLTSDGPRWTRQRRLLQPAFHRESVSRQATMMQEIAARWVEGLPTDGQRLVRLDEIAMQTTLAIVSRALFGADLLEYAAEVAGAIADLQRAANRRICAPFALPFAIPTPEHLHIRRARWRIRRILARLVFERRGARRDRETPDVIDLLLGARDADTGAPLSLDAVLDELVTLLIAGHESTANALTWAVTLLATHAAELAAVRAELDALGAPGPLTFEHLARLPRTRAVVDETMRLYPPAWSFGRAPRRDDVIAGHPVPAGRLVMVVPWATHRDRTLFAHPEAFDPSRFLGATPPAFSYLPFGAGPRTCIGHAFARTEAQLVLATWLRAVDFELVPGQDLEPAPFVTLRPRDGVLVRVSRRRG
ncbi:MAG: cytochrome P450 [Labilithrix sp.]|nr:cytochrome P450 [Labilithrix sp.]MBX3213553.1 cytochrome P450 [Labilithrix sp.]